MKKVVSLLLVGILLFSSVKPAGANFIGTIVGWYKGSVERIKETELDNANKAFSHGVLRYVIRKVQRLYLSCYHAITRRSPAAIPMENIVKHFDKMVTGQAKTKKILAAAGSNHYKKISAKNGVKLQKNNVLILGPTGSGKTFLAQTMAEFLNLPFVIADSIAILYGGDSIENILERLIKNSGGDVKLAEKGIIFLDEVDKLAEYKPAQKRFLKPLEGTDVHFECIEKERDLLSDQLLPVRQTVNTSNILFVCSGAFVGLENIIKRRTNNADATLSEVSTEDLIAFGFLPEFVGRMPIVSTLDPLSASDLVTILTKPKNCLVKQYQELCACDNVELEFEEEALDKIAEKAIKKQLGARGLVSVLEDFMKDVFYKISTDRSVRKCIITAESVEKGESPMFEYGPPPSESFWQKLTHRLGFNHNDR
jgi:ATP-dependent Clp protease ATP-binding subunit ClpX